MAKYGKYTIQYNILPLKVQTVSSTIEKNRRGYDMGGIVEIDLHGKTEYQARMTLDAALRRAKSGTYRLRVIHGYHNGTALRDMVRREYAARVVRAVILDEGRTDLVLREF